MVTSIGGILAVIAGCVALAALLGVMYARFISSKGETTTQIWKDEAAAYKAKSERESIALRELTASFTLLSARVTKVEAENTLLRELVTAKHEINELSARVDEGFNGLRHMLGGTVPGVTVSVAGH